MDDGKAGGRIEKINQTGSQILTPFFPLDFLEYVKIMRREDPLRFNDFL